MTQELLDQPVKKTALYTAHRDLGAKLVPFGGYTMPVSYPNGIQSEYFSVSGRKKREVNFSKEPFNKNYKPLISKEWSINGKLIYDRAAFLKKIN